MSEPAIRLRHVTHRFGDLAAVEDLCLDVPAGEIFGFIGPNGAGKTTTIRMIATLLAPTRGRVLVHGADASIDPLKVRRLVGYLPDHSGVYERITVREYLEFFAAAAAVPPRSVDAAIELASIGEWEPRLVATLSKGMRQRLGLARILLHDPSVLVLDEPASDLDPRARIEMRDLLIELRDLGKTVFLSSHILSELDDICTSVGILERGKLVAAGPIQAIAQGLGGARPARGEAPPGGAATEAGGEAPPVAWGRVRVRILGESADARPLAAAVAGVTHVEAGAGGWLSVEHRGGDDAIAEVVRALVQGGHAVVAVEPERAELERIFMEVTKGRST